MRPFSPPDPAASAAVAGALRALGFDPDAAPWRALDGGRTNRLWRVGERVVKLYRPQAATPVFPNDAAAEARALRALDGTGLAPRLRGLVEGETGVCLVYDHVPGPAGGIDPEAAGRTLARLHARPAPPGFRRPPARAEEVLADGEAMLAALPHGQADRLGRLRPAVRDVVPARPVFLHGDPVPANIVRAETGPCLIDWQCPAGGDPVIDLALFLSPAMQSLYGGAPLSAQEEAAFLAAYGDAGQAERYRRLAPFHRWRMAVYCLWKAGRGDADYAAAAELELAWLEQGA